MDRKPVPAGVNVVRKRMYYMEPPKVDNMTAKELDQLVNDRIAMANAVSENLRGDEQYHSRSYIDRVEAKLQKCRAGPKNYPFNFYKNTVHLTGARLRKARDQDSLSHFLCRAYVCRAKTERIYWTWSEYKLLRHRLLRMAQADPLVDDGCNRWCDCSFEMFTKVFTDFHYGLMGKGSGWVDVYKLDRQYAAELMEASGRVYKVNVYDYKELIGEPENRMKKGQYVFIGQNQFIDMICHRYRRYLDQELVKLETVFPAITQQFYRWPYIKFTPNENPQWIPFSQYLSSVGLSLTQLLGFFTDPNAQITSTVAQLPQIKSEPVSSTITESTPQPTQTDSSQEEPSHEPWEDLDLSRLDTSLLVPETEQQSFNIPQADSLPTSTQSTQTTVKTEIFEEWDTNFEIKVENSLLGNLQVPESHAEPTVVPFQHSQSSTSTQSEIGIQPETLPENSALNLSTVADQQINFDSLIPSPEPTEEITPRNSDHLQITKEVKVQLVRLTQKQIECYTKRKKTTNNLPKRVSPRKHTVNKVIHSRRRKPTDSESSGEASVVPEIGLDSGDNDIINGTQDSEAGEEDVDTDNQLWSSKKDKPWRPDKSEAESDDEDENENLDDLEIEDVTPNKRKRGRSQKKRRSIKGKTSTRKSARNLRGQTDADEESDYTPIPYSSTKPTRTARKRAWPTPRPNQKKERRTSDYESEEDPANPQPSTSNGKRRNQKRSSDSPKPKPHRRILFINSESDESESEPEREPELRPRKKVQRIKPSDINSDSDLEVKIIAETESDVELVDESEEESNKSDDDSDRATINLRHERRRYQCKPRTPREPKAGTDFIFK